MAHPKSTQYDPYAVCVRGERELVELAREAGFSQEAAEAVASIDVVMQKIRRSFQRRDFGRAVLQSLGSDLDVGHLDTLAAISGHAEEFAPEVAEVTVGLIAERLGIDPSRASRLAAEVVERGYARRVASQTDARRICLELTPRGRTFIDAFRRNKWELFSQALGSWSEADLVTFAELMSRFSDWATANDGIARSASAIRARLEAAEETRAPEPAK